MTLTLSQLAGKFDNLANLSVYEAIQKEVADEGLKLVRAEFDNGVDPYGNRWDSLQNPFGQRIGGPLVKTGAMRDSVKANPISSGVRFTVNAPYAAYQQYGTETIPSRRMLPTSALGVPDSWRRMISAAFANVLHRVGGF